MTKNLEILGKKYEDFLACSINYTSDESDQNGNLMDESVESFVKYVQALFNSGDPQTHRSDVQQHIAAYLKDMLTSSKYRDFKNFMDPYQPLEVMQRQLRSLNIQIEAMEKQTQSDRNFYMYRRTKDSFSKMKDDYVEYRGKILDQLEDATMKEKNNAGFLVFMSALATLITVFDPEHCLELNFEKTESPKAKKSRPTLNVSGRYDFFLNV